MYSYRIEQALRAASILHQNQTRRGLVPIPYVSHLYAVALIVADYTKDENVVIAALLHDTLEDTDYTAQELEDDFGEDVCRFVQAVSEPQTEAGEAIPWEARKKAYVEGLRKAPQEALLIAAADKIHNMRSIVEEYCEHHERFLKDFGGSLEERMRVYQDISNAINRNLKNDIIHEFNHVLEEYRKFIIDVKANAENKERR